MRYNTTREDTRGSGGTAGTHMDIGNKDKNSKLGDFLREKVGNMNKRREFKKTRGLILKA